MKNNLFKRIGCIIIFTLLAVGLAGCTADQSTSQTSETTSLIHTPNETIVGSELTLDSTAQAGNEASTTNSEIPVSEEDWVAPNTGMPIIRTSDVDWTGMSLTPVQPADKGHFVESIWHHYYPEHEEPNALQCTYGFKFTSGTENDNWVFYGPGKLNMGGFPSMGTWTLEEKGVFHMKLTNLYYNGGEATEAAEATFDAQWVGDDYDMILFTLTSYSMTKQEDEGGRIEEELEEYLNVPVLCELYVDERFAAKS